MFGCFEAGIRAVSNQQKKILSKILLFVDYTIPLRISNILFIITSFNSSRPDFDLDQIFWWLQKTSI